MEDKREELMAGFRSFESRIKGLQADMKQALEERSQWVDENRKEIKSHIMPRTGSYYELADDLPPEWCKYHSSWSRLEPEQLDEVKYVRIYRAALYKTMVAGGWREENEHYPVCKGIFYSKDFVKLQDKHHDDAENAVRISVNELKPGAVSRTGKPSITPTNVYVMIDKNTGLYKIGRSVNPIKRERTLQSEKPTVELLFHHEGVHADETSLHITFGHKRVRGEWFKLDADDLQYVKEYMVSQGKTDEQDESE